MRAAVMYGAGDVRVETLPDPIIIEPTDAIVRAVRSCICGSDLHPYHSLPPMPVGAPMGHELIGVVEVRPGQTLYTPPLQEHWHAAPPDTFMEHIALLEAGEDPATTTVWGEHVTDAEYGR